MSVASIKKRGESEKETDRERYMWSIDSYLLPSSSSRSSSSSSPSLPPPSPSSSSAAAVACHLSRIRRTSRRWLRRPRSAGGGYVFCADNDVPCLFDLYWPSSFSERFFTRSLSTPLVHEQRYTHTHTRTGAPTQNHTRRARSLATRTHIHTRPMGNTLAEARAPYIRTEFTPLMCIYVNIYCLKVLLSITDWFSLLYISRLGDRDKASIG